MGFCVCGGYDNDGKPSITERTRVTIRNHAVSLERERDVEGRLYPAMYGIQRA